MFEDFIWASRNSTTRLCGLRSHRLFEYSCGIPDCVCRREEKIFEEGTVVVSEMCCSSKKRASVIGHRQFFPFFVLNASGCKHVRGDTWCISTHVRIVYLCGNMKYNTLQRGETPLNFVVWFGLGDRTITNARVEKTVVACIFSRRHVGARPRHGKRDATHLN